PAVDQCLDIIRRAAYLQAQGQIRKMATLQPSDHRHFPTERGPSLNRKTPRPNFAAARLATSSIVSPTIVSPAGEMATNLPVCSASNGFAYRSYRLSPRRTSSACSTPMDASAYSIVDRSFVILLCYD